MTQLSLYTVDNAYVKKLHNVDSEVFYRSTNYDDKPYAGIIVMNGSYKYFIPLTSAKSKHIGWQNVTKNNYILYEIVDKAVAAPFVDWITTIYDNNNIKHILSVLEIKKMIPVPDGMYHKINFSTITDSSYRSLLEKEYNFLSPLFSDIESKAHALYNQQKKSGVVYKLFCNFTALEAVHDAEVAHIVVNQT